MLLKRKAIHEQDGRFPRRDRGSGGEGCRVEGRAVRQQLGGSSSREVGGPSGCRGDPPSPEVIVLSSSGEELDDETIDVEVVMPTKPAMESNKIPPRKEIPPVIKNYTRQAAFQSAEFKKEFKRSFKKPRASPGLSQTALEKKAREILHDMTRPARQAVRASQVAWNQAAMKWREKNRPSSEAVLKRRQEDAARAQQSSKQRAFNSPFSRAYASDEPSTIPEGNVKLASSKPPLQRPPPDAPEVEWRGYYRQVVERKIEHANSFVDILRVLHVPCEDSTRVKDAYRLAVRMYHPDSNSKEKVWNTEKEKIQAEEVLKIINERKPPDT